MAGKIKDEVKNRLSPSQKMRIKKLRDKNKKKDKIGESIRGFFGVKSSVASN